MAYSCVRVYFEIGHEASLRNKRTIDGFTHDWEVFVRGVDNAEIHHFIDKVVFHLHDTFPKPKRTIKEPPYCLKESGYAGFNLTIDIYLKNKIEHRKLRFYYDLTLQPSGPRLTKLIKEKADFTNPPEDFRRKLIKGGGVGVGNDSTSSLEKSNSITPNSHIDDSKSSPHSGKPKLNNSSSDIPKKHKPKETSKPEEARGSSFAALFGTPIKTVKHSPTSKPAPKTSASSEIKNSHEKQAKDSSKIPKHSPHKDKDKENSLNKYKDKEREKDKDAEKSNKDKTKEKEHKDKDKNKDKLPKKACSPIPPKDRKEESTKRPSEENHKDRSNSKNEIIKEKKHKEKKHKEEREKKDIHKEHDKKESDKEKLNDKIEKKQEIPKDKEVKEIKFKSSEKEEKKSKPSDREKDRSHDSEKQKHKHKRKEKHRKEDEKDRHKKKPKEKTPEPTPPPKPKSPTPPPPPPPPPPPVPIKPSINPLNMLIQELSDKDSDSDFSVSVEDDMKSDTPSEPPPKPKIEDKKIDIREEREKVKKKRKEK